MNAAAKIAVVDDTPQNVKLLEAVLTTRGYEVIPAASGEEALAKIASEQPDLVLLDIVMPGMDGYEVCRRLRADPATALLAGGDDHRQRGAGEGAGDRGRGR